MAGFTGGGVEWADADLLLETSAGSLIGAHLALGLNPADALQTVAASGSASAPEDIEPAQKTFLPLTKKLSGVRFQNRDSGGGFL